MADVMDQGCPIIKSNDGNRQRNGPEAKDDLHFAEKMKLSGPQMDFIGFDLAGFDSFLVRLLPFMGNGQELAGHEGMQNGQDENQGGNQVEGLLLDAVFQDGPDPAQIGIVAGCALLGGVLGLVFGSFDKEHDVVFRNPMFDFGVGSESGCRRHDRAAFTRMPPCMDFSYRR